MIESPTSPPTPPDPDVESTDGPKTRQNYGLSLRDRDWDDAISADFHRSKHECL